MEKYINKIDSIFVNGLVSALISYLFLIIILIILNKLLNRLIESKYSKQEKIIKRYKKIIIQVLLVIGIMAQLQSFSFIATSILASGGLFAIVIGMASQEAASNIINGAFIMGYKPYRTNDFIEIPSQNLRGVVIDINLRHTIIETIEKTRLIIPNQVMNSVTIENVNNENQIKGNQLFLTISYTSDIDKAIEIIKDCSSKHPLSLDIRNSEEIANNKDIINVFCTNFLDSAIELRATVYSSNNTTGFEMLSDLRMTIKKEFDHQGIEIPFPHVVVKS